MSRIRILPENVANKIAAGEVVERPASVVKELVENALDAGARSIRVEVESGGKRLIRITDDGSGMNHDDALLAFERHATSKLRTTDDLLSIATLGFRGEALPSVAAVSRLVLETRTAEEEQGTRVEFAGGKLLSVKPAGVPAGTSISVADIFYCVPARRKFLKSETTELGHIASLVTHYALAHPDKQFLLKTPTQDIVNVTPVERLAERVYQIFGREALGEFLEIPASEGPVRAAITEPELEAGEEGAKIRVTGFTSRPEVQRTNRNAGFSRGSAVSRSAVSGSGRERASLEGRGTLPAPAVCPRLHARRNSPRAGECSADSGLCGNIKTTGPTLSCFGRKGWRTNSR
jgi:DNA mismatch repair protein MutL